MNIKDYIGGYKKEILLVLLSVGLSLTSAAIYIDLAVKPATQAQIDSVVSVLSNAGFFLQDENGQLVVNDILKVITQQALEGQ